MSSSIHKKSTVADLPVAPVATALVAPTDTIVTVEKAQAVLTADRGMLSVARSFFSALTFGVLVSKKSDTAFTVTLDKFAEAHLAIANSATTAAVRAARPVRAEAVKSLAGRVVALSGDNTASFAAAAKELMTKRLTTSGLKSEEIAHAHRQLDAAMQELAVKKFVGQLSIDSQNGNLHTAIVEEAERLHKAGIFATPEAAAIAISNAFAQQVQARFPVGKAGDDAFNKKIEDLESPEKRKAVVDVRLAKEQAELNQLIAKRNALYNCDAAMKVTDANAWKAGLSEDEEYLFLSLHTCKDVGFEFGRYLNGSLGNAQLVLLKARVNLGAAYKKQTAVLSEFAKLGLLDESAEHINIIRMREATRGNADVTKLHQEYEQSDRNLVAAHKGLAEAAIAFGKVREEFNELDNKVLAKQNIVADRAKVEYQVNLDTQHTVASLKGARVYVVEKVSTEQELRTRFAALAAATRGLRILEEGRDINPTQRQALRKVLPEDQVAALLRTERDDVAVLAVSLLANCRLDMSQIERQLVAMERPVNLD